MASIWTAAKIMVICTSVIPYRKSISLNCFKLLDDLHLQKYDRFDCIFSINIAPFKYHRAVLPNRTLKSWTHCLFFFSNFSEWGNDWNSHPKPYLFPNNHGPHGRYGLVPTQLWYGGRFQMGTELKLRICAQQLLRMDGNPSKSRLEHSSVLQQSQTRSFRDRMHRRSVISCFVQFSSTQQSIAILLSGTLKSVLPTLIVLYFHEIFAVKNKVENELTKFLFRKVENLVISG